MRMSEVRPQMDRKNRGKAYSLPKMQNLQVGEGMNMTATHPFDHSKANTHPIDVSTLDKGMFITPEECEDHCGKKRGSREYQFALQSLREYIYRESMRDGRPLSCGIKGDGVMIHTDSEAAEYHRAMNDQAVSALRRSSRRLAGTVDRSQLSAGEQSNYDRAVAVAAMRCQMIRKAGRLVAKEQKQLPA